MSKQILEMWYHPAKKEVIFKLFRGNAPLTIPRDSNLQKYMRKEKGSFILQNQGPEFFDAIAKMFNSLPEGAIRAITTKEDYIDFQQMVEHYNSSGKAKCQFTVLPGSVRTNAEAYLPDMDVICNEVRQHGVNAVNVLKKYDLELLNFPRSKSEYARKSLKDFRESIQKSIDNITKNMERLKSNTVNLCFAGVYSAGKSALINALLGYRILPESVKSETAKMFHIRSPRFDQGENISLSFTIGSKPAELQWDDAGQMKDLVGDFAGNRLAGEINVKAIELKGKPQHQQIYTMLEVLNSALDVGSEIHVKFPIPLDTPEVQFSIYDTPGSDSNFAAHEEILRGALANQTSSILIFVALPKKLEGTGNRKLLSLVNASDTAEHRSPIDISRSLFVINAADTIRPRERLQLKDSEISDEEDSTFAIKLANQKLLFTSALYAYAAKSVQNGTLPSDPEDDTFDDAYYFEEAVKKANEGERGKYYKEDCCASSEYATANLLSACDGALRKAQETGDNAEIVHVCSGLYALEHEILQYGKKYAAAVRAYAIINSVESVLAGMNLTASSLNSKNLAEINRISSTIARVQDETEEAIEQIVDSYRIGDSDKLPHAVLKRLNLDNDSIQTRIKSIQTFIEKSTKGLWKRWPKDATCVAISQKASAEIGNILSGYSQAVKNLLREMRDEVVGEVKDYIRNNGNLTEEAKNFVCDFVSNDISFPITPFGRIQQAYQGNIETKLFIIKLVNVENLERDVKAEMLEYFGDLADKLKHHYKNSLEEILSLVNQQFVTGLSQYSALLKGLIEDKDSMENLGNQIRKIESELQVSQKDLNELIWKEEKP